MKLTTELVPRTCWFSNVRSEVTPKLWETLRKTTSDKAGAKCEICGGVGPRWPVECHEIWAYDDNLKTQTLTGLIALCPNCHCVKHIGLTESRGPDFYNLILKHMAMVNGTTTREAEAHIRDAFKVWRERSQHQWTLDISWLEQHGYTPKVTP